MSYSKISLIVIVLCALLVGTPRLDAQEGHHVVRIDGTEEGKLFGSGVALHSDSEASPDGVVDILIGRHHSGIVFWYSVAGFNATLLDDSVSSGLWLNCTSQLRSGFDSNQDGWEEVLVDNVVIDGKYPHDKLNFSLYTRAFVIGDFNGDGITDLADWYTHYSYRCRVHSGKDGTLIWESSNGSKLGFCTTDAGDLNGDGYDDIVVSEPEYLKGRIHAYAGGPIGDPITGSEIWYLDAESTGDRFEVIVNMGDLDGDFVDDFAVGSPGVDAGGLTNTGRICIVSGQTGTIISKLDGFAQGLEMGSGYGRDVYACDLTADCCKELVVGLPNYDANGLQNSGAVRIYKWNGTELTLWREVDGNNTGDRFGYAVTGGCDVTGDGFQDLVVSSPYADPNSQTDAGSVFVFKGGDPVVGPMIETVAQAEPGDEVPFELYNAEPGQVFILLASPSGSGSKILGHQFQIGYPQYVVAVAGKVPLAGHMRVHFRIPYRLPGLPRTIYFEGLIFDPRHIPFAQAVTSTNMENVLVQ